MAVYQPKFSEGAVIMYKGRYLTIMGVSEDAKSADYKIHLKGRKKSIDAALVDREAHEVTFDDLPD
jgi:hypothetical protein